MIGRILIELIEGVDFTKEEIDIILTKTKAEIGKFDKKFVAENEEYCKEVATAYSYALLHSIRFK
ncbi:hypothetical protein [Chryseobacterium sp.]|uniref:hypothetical protein n=1 Tax=Chryseobacterium sp. TaxID=1871047 RepID=UPI002FCAFEFC